MRKFLYAGKAAAIVFASVCAMAAALVISRSPVFERGESYEVYYGASSSCPMKRTESPLSEKLTGEIAGESVRYEGDRYEELKARFHAELLFTEEADGVTNYYLYSPELGGGVAVGGYFVNLHIATKEGRTAAGTPLIFGGY